MTVTQLSAVRDGKGTDAYDLVTETIIKALEDGTVPWRKPWTTAGSFPLSLSTRKPYRGINVLLLGLAGTQYTSPWWGTYKKIHEMGGQVRKGERSTVVTFWKKLRITEEIDGKKQPKDIFMLRYYRVFNADQADWTEGRKPVPPVKGELTEHERIESAEAIVSGYANGPAIQRVLGRSRVLRAEHGRDHCSGHRAVRERRGVLLDVVPRDDALDRPREATRPAESHDLLALR